MKITFVYTDYGLYNQNNFNRGVAILSSCLKQKGHEVSLIHIWRRTGKKEFIALVKRYNPDLIAFSFLSNMFDQIKAFSLWAKELNIPAIHGGMHPTVAPGECLAEEGIDVVCRGEGEGAIVDFCRSMESGKDIKNIPNIWVKEKDHIYQNQCRELITDLDALPYADYELFDYKSLEEGFVHKILVTQASRGCLHNCTYCCSPLARSIYPKSGKFLRYYSVDRLLDEIEFGLKKYPFLQEVRFYDDTITQDRNWFKEFAEKYKKRIGLPYSGSERVENIDEETSIMLKASGCISLDLGIENGNRIMRGKYMNRHMSNEKIIEAFRFLKLHGISANGLNILGMVGETPETALDTIKLNARVRPLIVFKAYFYPFKGTKAYDMVKERGYRINEKVSSFFERPVVELDTIRKSQIIFFYKYFDILADIYNILMKRSGNEASTVKALDNVLTSGYFPYSVFNFFHFGEEDIIALLRRYPMLYMFMRRIYRSIRRSKIRTPETGVMIVTKDIYIALRRIVLRLVSVTVARKEPRAGDIMSILVIRIERIGDLVASLPALKALRQVFPDAKISVLVREGNNELSGCISWIDEFILYRGFADTVKELRRRRFDMTIDLLMDYRLKTAFLAYMSNSGFTAGFDIASRGLLFNLSFAPAREKKHVSEYMLDFVKMLARSLSMCEPEGDFFKDTLLISEDGKKYAEHFLSENSIKNTDIVIAIHPGGYFASQRWQVADFSWLADRIEEKYGAGIVIMGGADEKGLIDEMAGAMEKKAVKAYGLSLDKLAALIDRVDLLICNSSGPLHIAAALNTFTVSTMGPTDPVLWRPRGENHIVIRKGTDCSPCDRPVCAAHTCMSSISVEEMMEAVDLQIKRIKHE